MEAESGVADDEEIQRGHDGRDGEALGGGTQEESLGLHTGDDTIHTKRVSRKELTFLLLRVILLFQQLV